VAADAAGVVRVEVEMAVVMFELSYANVVAPTSNIIEF
jgi:hypothetical protein